MGGIEVKRTAAELLDRVEEFVSCNGRALDKARFNHCIHGAPPQDVVDALLQFQNPDGGFGRGLEPDFRLPDSSPVATWVGLGVLIDLDIDAQADIVRRALDYLLASFDVDVDRWLPVPPAVNDYPHAGWWHYDAAEGGTPIHRTPWTPTAALTGYLWHFVEPGPPAPGDLAARAIAYLEERAGTDLEMHELKCFVQLARLAPQSQARQQLRALATTAAQRVVKTNREEWVGYGAQPLEFVDAPGDVLYGELSDCVEANLDFWLDTLGDDGVWPLTWKWRRDDAEFERLRPEITASLAVQRTIALRAFGRV